VGITRKTLSILTAGIIDFRSDKERIARYTRQTRDSVRAQGQGAPGSGLPSFLVRQDRLPGRQDPTD
jgi:hypothetical protein